MKQLDQAFVLSRVAYSETSWVIKCYTAAHGLKSFLVQGGRKKYAEAITAMSHIEFTWSQVHEDSLSRMFEVRNEIMPGIRFEPIKTGIAFYQAELLQHALKEGQADKLLFQFIEQELHWLNSNEVPPNYLLYWTLELSGLLGFRPHSPEEPIRALDLVNGEFGNFASNGNKRVSGAEVQLLHTLNQLDRDGMLAFETKREERHDCLALLLSYYVEHVPGFRKLKCLEVYEMIW